MLLSPLFSFGTSIRLVIGASNSGLHRLKPLYFFLSILKKKYTVKSLATMVKLALYLCITPIVVTLIGMPDFEMISIFIKAEVQVASFTSVLGFHFPFINYPAIVTKARLA